MVTGAEQVVDRAADGGQPLLCQTVAGVRRHGLAQRAQHVLAQRRGVLRPGQPGAFVGGQRRAVKPHSRPVAAGDTRRRRRRRTGRAGCPAHRRAAGEVLRRHRVGLGDHGGQRPRHGQPGVNGGGHRGEYRLRILGPAGSTPAAVIRIWLRGSASGCRPRHSSEPSASWRRATSESCLTGMSSDGIQVRR